MDFLQTLVSIFMQYGYFAVFGILILCGFGLPVPEDISLTAGGVISGLGYANVHIMFLVGMAGVLLGDAFVFWLGSYYGEKALTLPILRTVLHPERFDKVREQFKKYGRWVVFFGRFMPGLRMPIFFTAGTSKQISFIRFFLTDGFAALISVPIWVYLGYYGAHNFDELMGWVRNGQTIILVLVGVSIAGLAFYWWRRKHRESRGEK
ncbi:DedA family protein [Leptospira bourretii]|uniref:DedA family protein n=1 Tax=Leptospira bourretii TaxID=2484962 RepID=A0A4R9IN61_9LEPT|nr:MULTISPECIES: DedA family protein [Leptospira]MCG6141079.1 DedA family protein [Leptospira mtsangambouensis]TGK84897.1 DedA family protein [Leptospira bourretii]TGK90664.1 DedA family protein [Leptospira bourretii]TGL23613.1 DedA family protein [Leptospira bourretii]TGL36087.1 DedA family protein [Leptospira bourretii]